MDSPKGILVTIEGWGVNLAGCYGNSLLPTPSIDRLAAHSVVFDQFWMQSIHLEPNLSAISKKLQPSQWLVATDSIPAVSSLRQHEDLERLEVSHEETQESFEHLLTEALECWIEQSQVTPYLWIHSRGLNGPWDAPYEYKKLMCDTDDPDPPSDNKQPDLILEANFDPDLLFGIACGAGAQSVCIDQGIGLILQSLKELGIDQQCWLSVAGLLGFPLGEHRRVGLGIPSDLSKDAYSERLHTPWILRPAAGYKLGTRTSNLLQPSDMGHWLEQISEASQNHLLDFFSSKPPLAWARGNNEFAVLTDRWSARFDIQQDASGKLSLVDAPIGEVFCFPEDRWQQNEISSRVPDAVSLLRQIATMLLEQVEDELSSSEHLTDLLSQLSSIQR